MTPSIQAIFKNLETVQKNNPQGTVYTCQEKSAIEPYSAKADYTPEPFLTDHPLFTDIHEKDLHLLRKLTDNATNPIYQMIGSIQGELNTFVLKLLDEEKATKFRDSWDVTNPVQNSLWATEIAQAAKSPIQHLQPIPVRLTKNTGDQVWAIATPFVANRDLLDILEEATVNRDGSLSHPILENPQFQQDFLDFMWDCFLMGEPDAHANNIGIVLENGNYQKIICWDHEIVQAVHYPPIEDPFFAASWSMRHSGQVPEEISESTYQRLKDFSDPKNTQQVEWTTRHSNFPEATKKTISKAAFILNQIDHPEDPNTIYSIRKISNAEATRSATVKEKLQSMIMT